MSTVSTRSAARQHLLLDNVDWRTYSRLLHIFAERPGYRLAYDRGRLEIMSPLPEHECDADFLGCLLRALTEELGLPLYFPRFYGFRLGYGLMALDLWKGLPLYRCHAA